VDIPVILVPVNLDLIMMDSDMVAAFRTRGANAVLANSEEHAVELVKIFAVPRILDGKRALIFGRPFDSTSVPMGHLNGDFVYRQTGLRIRYRPVDDLMPFLEEIEEAEAVKEMERWKREAAKVLEPSDKAILDSARMYLLLRSLVEKEDLAAISIDCLSFSFSGKPPLPLPCLAFTRLRDEGITAPCEADICALLTSMVLQEISRKPAYQCNLAEMDFQRSIAVLRHCVAPLQLMGRDAPPLPYNLRDYHGMGKGATPEVEFPIGIDVTLGLFNKDLKSFVLWPGKTQSRVNDINLSPVGNASASFGNVRKYCSNQLAVKFRDIDRLHRNLGGCHHVMIAGTYEKALREEMMRMGVHIIATAISGRPFWAARRFASRFGQSL
jgi:L-fucose isomerase-like protein